MSNPLEAFDFWTCLHNTIVRTCQKTGKMTKRKQELCQQKENAKLFADAETSSKYTSETCFGLNHREHNYWNI
jgi:hypothetical protein